jgi:hypothetical protein
MYVYIVFIYLKYVFIYVSSFLNLSNFYCLLENILDF